LTVLAEPSDVYQPSSMAFGLWGSRYELAFIPVKWK
jgi:hypothetical protein